MRSHRFASVLLLALSSLAGAGCSDDVTSVPADDASVADQLNASVNNARRRMPYFTDVQVTPTRCTWGSGRVTN